MSGSIDFLELHARKKLGVGDNWKAFRYSCLPSNSRDIKMFEITGAVCESVFTKGPRKGNWNWKKRDKSTETSAYFSPQDHQIFVKEWEKQTGMCSECSGTGQRLVGWSLSDGKKYRPCGRCCETGKLEGRGK